MEPHREPRAARLAEARAPARALGPDAFAPFSARDAIGLSDVPAVRAWPFDDAAPTRDAAHAAERSRR